MNEKLPPGNEGAAMQAARRKGVAEQGFSIESVRHAKARLLKPDCAKPEKVCNPVTGPAASSPPPCSRLTCAHMPLGGRLLDSPLLPDSALLLLLAPRGSSVLASLLARPLLALRLSGSDTQSMILTATRPPCSAREIQ